MNSNDFDDWNREAIISSALEYRSEAERLRRELIDVGEAHVRVIAERDRLREALEHVMKGDMDPEDRVVIAQILAGETQKEAEIGS